MYKKLNILLITNVKIDIFINFMKTENQYLIKS